VAETIDRASRDGKDIDYEHRLLMPDGSIKYVHVLAHGIGNQAGQLNSLPGGYGHHRDQTS
jgi:hypothetical protein